MKQSSETILFTDEEMGVAPEKKGAKVVNENKKSSIDKLIDGCNHLIASVRGWYGAPNEAYSTIAGQKLSPKAIVRVNLMTVILVAMVYCAVTNVLVTGVTTACVGWLVYHSRVNTPNKDSKKKGGKA